MRQARTLSSLTHHPAFPGELWNASRPHEMYKTPTMSWVSPGVSREIPTMRHPYQMPQTTWLFWMQRSSNFTLSTIQIYRLLALLLKVSPATLLRKLISATCSFSHYPKLLDNGEGWKADLVFFSIFTILQHNAFTADTSPASNSIDILLQFYLLHISAVCLAFCVMCVTLESNLSAAVSYEWF